MGGIHKVGADANALTYFVESMWDGYDPRCDRARVACERAAMMLAYLYTGQPYTLLPTVAAECSAISDSRRLNAHQEVTGTLLLDVVHPLPADSVMKRHSELEAFHREANDCAILAEAELVGLRYLLSFDEDFVARLQPHARGVQLMKPSDYWAALAIPPRTRSVLQPNAANPLAKMDWWRSWWRLTTPSS